MSYLEERDCLCSNESVNCPLANLAVRLELTVQLDRGQPGRLRSKDPPGGCELSGFPENTLQRKGSHHRTLRSDRRLFQHSISPSAGDYF